jgi:general secretion pathway protein L
VTEHAALALVPPLHRADAPVQFWPDAGGNGPLTLILPAIDCPVSWVTIDAATPRQAAAAARAQVLAAAIDADVHVVAEPAAGPVPVATVSHDVMAHWLGWAAANGHDVAGVTPAALALPAPTPGTLHMATLAGERMARSDTRAFALEPGLEDVLTGGAPLVAVDAGDALTALAATPQLNLLTGRYAPPHADWFTRERIRTAGVLVALILLVSLAIGVARLLWLYADIARIDDENATLTSTALGRDIPADSAVAELDARLAATGASRGSANATLAALMQAMEGQASVGLDAASWDRAGTLTVTLGATRAEEINPVLLALQNAGYRITAQPRSGTDGRALGDVTIRSEP